LGLEFLVVAWTCPVVAEQGWSAELPAFASIAVLSAGRGSTPQK
jgi:hypothetical protein